MCLFLFCYFALQWVILLYFQGTQFVCFKGTYHYDSLKHASPANRINSSIEYWNLVLVFNGRIHLWVSLLAIFKVFTNIVRPFIAEPSRRNRVSLM